ncbi:trimeric LpxA-like protein [Aulographum hederae CBS 113979]|uniref:Dynactin subunit 6 n=1 Tax=Aulographum hederae CBS 113979 TaxID=1176131 RepID=A0A6G1GU35_9PEZI|nr:trimeric LpxA-like protein [Aulographum hederae CBS 113979]
MAEPTPSSTAGQPSPTKRVSSSRPTATKRTSTAHPRAPATIHPTAIIANHALLTGIHPITISQNAILHPYCKVYSTECPVEIGEGCIISERASVGLSSGDQNDRLEEGKVHKVQLMVSLGREVNVENGATVEAAEIGDGTIIQIDAKVGAGSVVGKHCKISPLCEVPPNDVVPDFTVIYGNNQRRIDKTAREHAEINRLKSMGNIMHHKTLSRLLPNNAAKWQ